MATYVVVAKSSKRVLGVQQGPDVPAPPDNRTLHLPLADEWFGVLFRDNTLTWTWDDLTGRPLGVFNPAWREGE